MHLPLGRPGLHETTLPPVPVPAEPDPAAPAPAAPALPETAAEISKHSDSADSAVAVTLAPAFPKMPALVRVSENAVQLAIQNGHTRCHNISQYNIY
jgi:hypothetical protein